MRDFRASSQVLVAIIASIGSFLYGIGIGWSSTSAIRIMVTERSFEITKNQFAWAVAMNSVGGCVGCLFSGLIRDRAGSKISIYIFTAPGFFGWMLLTFAQFWWMLILGRLFIGIAAAGYSYNVLIYVGECASKEIRGILLTFYEISLKCGILFSYALGTFTQQSVTNAICGALVIGYGIAFAFLPESPLFLVKQCRTEEAKKSLRFLRGPHYKMDDELTSLQVEIAKLELTSKPFWREIRTRATRNAFMILISMFFFFQMCGINAVVFYQTSILIESGIEMDPFVATCMLGVVQVMSCAMCATTFVDRCGRKLLLVLSNVIMIVGLLGVGSYIHIKSTSSMQGFEWLPLLLFCIYFSGFSLGVGSVTFVLMGELLSMNAKRVVGPMAQITNFIMSFLIAIFFPSIASYIGMQYTFFIFAGFCLLAIIFIVFKLPETKGRTLVEIQTLLSDGSK